MAANLVAGAGIVVVGVAVLGAAWIIHWVLILVGIAVVALGLYLALGGQVAGI